MAAGSSRRSRSHQRHRPGRGLAALSGLVAKPFAVVTGVFRNPRALLTIAIGLVLAVFAFAQAAAQIGVPIGAFRPLGTNFYAWRADQVARDLAFARAPDSIPADQFVAAGQDVLRGQPLATPAIRTIGWGYAVQGQGERATAAMLTAERISRRDTQAQQWLLTDVARRDDLPGTLHHLDVLLRVEPRLHPELLPRLASVLALPEARRELRALLTPDTPWAEGLTRAAADAPASAAPLAQMILEQRSVPDSPIYRLSYARLVQRLVDERQVALLRRVYPLLPGVDPVTLGSIALDMRQFNAGYSPLTWTLSADADWGGSLVSSPNAVAQAGLEGFADPGTRGPVATKFVIMPTGATKLAWRVLDRAGGPGSDGYWQVTCVNGGTESSPTRSQNLFAQGRRDGAMAIPSNCPAARVELVIAGGTGGTQANLTVGNLAIDGTPVARTAR